MTLSRNSDWLFYYQPDDYVATLHREELDRIANPPVFESKYMSKKTEVTIEEAKTDDNGIITKQSEVYVWNDQVFASYKAALAASKKDRIVDLLVEKQYPHSAGYTAAQRKQYASQWKANPLSYSVNTKYVLDTIIELLAD